MTKLLIIWLLIILLYIKNTYLQNPSSCGVSKIIKTELIRHGSHTIPGAWPWHVAIYRRDGRTVSYICGGTLISEVFVLTAAHCVRSDENMHQLSKKRIFVRLGVHNLDALNAESLQQHAVEQIHRPATNTAGQNFKNDIALLELATDAQFNDFVQPACVSSTSDLMGQFGTVVGWGVTEDDEVSPTLKGARMPMVDFTTCLESNRALFGATLDGGMFCAGYSNGTSVCNGDSGGGIFFNNSNVWYLGGIVSFSQLRNKMTNLCHTQGYAGFTNVYTYLPWISSVTKQKFSSKQIVPCTTPLKNEGQCVPIHRCRNIYCIVTHSTPPPTEMADYINQAECTLPNIERSICCQRDQVINSLPFYVNQNPKTNLLPKQCGLSLMNRIVMGSLTDLFEYPWMAVLQYNENGSIIDGCSGSLINQRYILTAAHCIKTRSALRLTNIRLGEHTKNQEVDCVGDRYEADCSGRIEDYTIESFVIHPDYNRPKFSNDIGLIRLTKDVVMRDNIRPICLPVTPELRTQQFERFILTGWGVTENSTGFNTLSKAVLQRVDTAECQQRITQNRLNMQLSDKQICAGGQDPRDNAGTCLGDLGGPLGTFVKHDNQSRFMQIGIVSAGVNSCDIPGIYSRVGGYMDWILDNMEP